MYVSMVFSVLAMDPLTDLSPFGYFGKLIAIPVMFDWDNCTLARSSRSIGRTWLPEWSLWSTWGR